MNMKTRYVVKGINKEQTISSIVSIALDSQGRIIKLEDKWDGKLPDGAISNVGLIPIVLVPDLTIHRRSATSML